MSALTFSRSLAIFVASLLALPALSGCSSTADPVRTGNPRLDLKSSDPVVVQMACRIVTEVDDIESIPALISNLRHENPNIRLMSHTALRDLVNLQPEQSPFGYSWLLENPMRERAVVAWEDWLKTEGRAAIDNELELRIQDRQNNVKPSSSRPDSSDN